MQPWKEFSTKQSFWQAVCLRPPAFWSRPAAEPSSQRPTRDCSRSPSPCLSPFYAPRSPKLSRHPRAYWPFRHAARRRSSFPLRSPSYRLPSMTARAASIARTFCVSRARSPYRDCRMPYARDDAAAFDGIASLLCDRGLRSLGSHEHNARPPAHRLEHAGRTGLPGTFTSQEESQPSRLAR